MSAQCQTHDTIDNSLRAYLSFTSNYKGWQFKMVEESTGTDRVLEEYLQSEFAVARCSFKLLESGLFIAHKDYVRRQIIYSLLQVGVFPALFWAKPETLQEDAASTLHLIAAFLLFDGRQHEETLEMMNEEGVFPRLLELIQDKKVEDAALHRMLLELLYEMSRIQRLRTQDLCRCCSPCAQERLRRLMEPQY